ncbi:MAG TPA: serine/threonine-protein kinase [Candidatus Melainabacteria bacterium]|nr:serine/threonine-protein kinase [Candidatus Melainabacteria bacterium]
MAQNTLVGQILDGRYKLLDVAGEGRSGYIYKAEQMKFNRTVAVKILHDYLVENDEAIKRFQREAQAVSKLKHPNLLTIIDFGFTEDGQPYMVTEFLDGISLRDLVASGKKLGLDQTLSLFQQICSGLAAAHDQQIVHRDIKP